MPSPSSPVRVRIAPSPTGPLHVGTARTALFNMLFARRHGGVFLIRIEDTDTRRSRSEYTQQLLEGLSWLGIEWEEGPEKGGPYGPYIQSERVEQHLQAIHRLLEEGKAYERDGAVVLRVPEETVLTLHDLIRGTVTFPASELMDFIIAKPAEDKRAHWVPLFHLAVVLDDAAMNITHIIRGEDHLSNTPKHILLQRALGLATPEYAHLPLLLDTERKKLSKRTGTTSILEYRTAGYLPSALLNFLALLGWNPKTNEEVFSLEELCARFDLPGVQKGGAVFDLKKLDWLQRQHLRRLSPAELVAAARPFLADEDCENEQRVQRALLVWRERGGALRDARDAVHLFFHPPLLVREQLPWKNATEEETREALLFGEQVLQHLPDMAWETPETLQNALLDAVDRAKKDRATVLWPLRYAVSGMQKSPSPGEMCWILGKEEANARIRAARAQLEHP